MSTPLYLLERRIEIDAAHRATLDGTKCSNLHGHRYTIIVSCVGPLIEDGPQKGMVMDFGILKKILMEEIDAPCDHATIMWVDDPMTQKLIDDADKLENTIRPEVAARGFCRIADSTVGALYLIPTIPTAENLAAHWFARIAPRIKALETGNVTLRQIRVFESPQCMAAFPAL